MTTMATLITSRSGRCYEVAVDYETVREGVRRNATMECETTRGTRAIIDLTGAEVEERIIRSIGFAAAQERYAAERATAVEAAHDYPLEA